MVIHISFIIDTRITPILIVISLFLVIIVATIQVLLLAFLPPYLHMTPFLLLLLTKLTTSIRPPTACSLTRE